MNLEEVTAPYLRNLIEITAAKYLSIGVNFQHIAISMRPQRGIGPTRLGKKLEQAGTRHFLETIKAKGGWGMTQGSFGKFALRLNKNMPLFPGEPVLLSKERGKPLLTVFLQSHEIDNIDNMVVLPWLVGVPVWLNGRSVKQLAHSGVFATNPGVAVKWRALGRSGTVTYVNSIDHLILVHNNEWTSFPNFPVSFIVALDADSPVDDPLELLAAIGRHLRKTLIVKGFSLEEAGTPVSDLADNLTKQARDLKVINGGVVELALFLGMGVRAAYSDVGESYQSGIPLAAGIVFPSPSVVQSESIVPASLVPQDIPIVAKTLAAPYVNAESPIIRGVINSEAQVKDMILVRIVEEIKIGAHYLPHLFWDDSGPITVDGELIPSFGVPSLFIARNQRSIAEIWSALADNDSLIKVVYFSLLSLWEDKTKNTYLDSYFEQGYHTDKDIDQHLFAAKLLSMASHWNEEDGRQLENIYKALYETSFILPAEENTANVCLDPQCDHQDIYACVRNARMQVLENIAERSE